MSAAEIRMELARRRMARGELARRIGVSADYMCKILRGERTAERRRAEATDYFRRAKAANRPAKGGTAERGLGEAEKERKRDSGAGI